MVGSSGSGEEHGPLRRNRDFVLFWSSQVLSTAGTRATTVAYPLLVLAQTGSAARAGLVGFAQTLPFIVWFLPAGALVDRLDRKRVMLITELIRFAAMASIVVALLTDRFALWHIVVVAFVEGSCLVFFELAEAAALPHIVPEAQLPTALAQNQARQQAADLSGQPIGGFLFGIGRSVPFVFDAISYAVSFVALLFIRPDFQDERTETATSLWAEITEGVRFLWRMPFLRTISFLVAAWNFVIAAVVLALIVRAQDLGAGPTAVGIVLAAFGFGALLGAAIAPAVQRRFGGRSIIIGSTLIWAVAVLLMAVVGNTFLLGAVFALGGLVGPSFNVMVHAYRYGLTPDQLQGRVLSASRVIGWGSIPLGSAVAGILIEAIDAVLTLTILATIMAAVAIAAIAMPSLRSDPLA